MNFQAFNFNKNILKALDDLGFVEPTPIQQKSIPALMAGECDYVGLAQTGTGKTAAFGLPLAQLVDPSKRHVQAIILCPTRELCVQITEELKRFTKYINDLQIIPVYGGAGMDTQIRGIKKGGQIIVGTPGRTLDLIKRNVLKLGTVRVAVLDEADEMLNMGFQEDIDSILKNTPSTRKTWLFSATMPERVERISHRYMVNPITVAVDSKNSGARNLEHYYSVVKSRDAYDAIRRFVDYYPGLFGILFCRTRREAKDIARKFMKDGYHADALHGDLSQSQRDAVMAKFRSKNLQLLVATDVAARGIDVSDVTHVFHHNLPDDIESYTHRSGRTARAGKSGISLAILNTRDARRIRIVERKIKTQILFMPVPSGQEVAGRQVSHLISNLNNQDVVVDPQLARYFDEVHEALKDVSKEELINTLVSKELQKIISTYDKAPDLNASGSSDDHSDSDDEPRLFVTIGSKDDLDKDDVVALVSEKAQVDRSVVHSVVLKETFTFFSVSDKETAEKIIAALDGTRHGSRTIRIELSSPKRGGGNRRHSGGSGGGGNRSRFRQSGSEDRSGKVRMRRRAR